MQKRPEITGGHDADKSWIDAGQLALIRNSTALRVTFTAECVVSTVRAEGKGPKVTPRFIVEFETPQYNELVGEVMCA